jgi:hypothetical protein
VTEVKLLRIRQLLESYPEVGEELRAEIRAREKERTEEREAERLLVS